MRYSNEFYSTNLFPSDVGQLIRQNPLDPFSAVGNCVAAVVREILVKTQIEVVGQFEAGNVAEILEAH